MNQVFSIDNKNSLHWKWNSNGNAHENSHAQAVRLGLYSSSNSSCLAACLKLLGQNLHLKASLLLAQAKIRLHCLSENRRGLTNELLLKPQIKWKLAENRGFSFLILNLSRPVGQNVQKWGVIGILGKIGSWTPQPHIRQQIFFFFVPLRE